MPAPVRSRHDRGFWSFWAILLLVLAVSPVTAPFSSCDLGALFADPGPHPGAILQSKVLQDKSVDNVAVGIVRDVPIPAASKAPGAGTRAPAPRLGIRHFPLRI